MMTYAETLDYLYTKLPMFTRIGAAALKNDLHNTLALCEALGNPERSFKSIHIAGTNGKGSTSHIMASILQTAGYKTGLYTSPHLLDFRERIRVNGLEIPKENVVHFVANHRDLIERIEPSFFEMTVALAFDHFRNEKVDIAVIETGLGGRLDSTNVITPLLSIITNISYDHQYLLGNTLAEIAGEKAGIIKPGIPVVIGQTRPETENVFIQKAAENHSPLIFAEKTYTPIEHSYQHGLLNIVYSKINESGQVNIVSPLAGNYQLENIATILSSVDVLKTQGINISAEQTIEGIKDVKKQTGLLGRWEVISESPLIICDVAHNEAGLRAVFDQINSIPHDKLHFVYGMVKDKDVEKALSLLPKDAIFYFSQPQLPRALEYETLYELARQKGLKGSSYPTIAEACAAAQPAQGQNDILLVAGSIFVVAEALEHFGMKE